MPTDGRWGNIGRFSAGFHIPARRGPTFRLSRFRRSRFPCFGFRPLGLGHGSTVRMWSASVVVSFGLFFWDFVGDCHGMVMGLSWDSDRDARALRMLGCSAWSGRFEPVSVHISAAVILIKSVSMCRSLMCARASIQRIHGRIYPKNPSKESVTRIYERIYERIHGRIHGRIHPKIQAIGMNQESWKIPRISKNPPSIHQPRQTHHDAPSPPLLLPSPRHKQREGKSITGPLKKRKETSTTFIHKYVHTHTPTHTHTHTQIIDKNGSRESLNSPQKESIQPTRNKEKQGETRRNMEKERPGNDLKHRHIIHKESTEHPSSIR